MGLTASSWECTGELRMTASGLNLLRFGFHQQRHSLTGSTASSGEGTVIPSWAQSRSTASGALCAAWVPSGSHSANLRPKFVLCFSLRPGRGSPQFRQVWGSRQEHSSEPSHWKSWDPAPTAEHRCPGCLGRSRESSVRSMV